MFLALKLIKIRLLCRVFTNSHIRERTNGKYIR